MKIAVDAMGGDIGVGVNVPGSIDALKDLDIKIVLIGKKEEIEDELKKYKYDKDQIEIVDAREIILNTEDPAMAIKRKKDSSIVLGMNMLKEKKVDAFVSAGSTGALLSGGVLLIKRIKGVDRPALGSVCHTKKGISFILDIGANSDCKPKYLEQFGIMGSIYSKAILGKKNPRVGIVNIGSEEEKGNELTKGSYQLLKKASYINFIGNIEARDVPKGDFDVLVCDGFTGNIIIKTLEGMAVTLFSIIKKGLMSNFKNKLAALLLKSDLMRLKEGLNYSKYGGAPLLGIKEPVIKAHGSSDAFAITNAIKQSEKFIKNEVIKIIEDNIVS